jgi:phage tail tape-measure protein
MNDDKIQHGIDDDPNNDAEKGATLGGVGGAVTGAVAGSAAGPVGTVIGAVVGGLAGAAGSGAAVAAVDKVDNDNTITGIGHGATTDVEDQAKHVVSTPNVGNGTPGVQTGGHALDGTPDTRGVTEKAADTLTGDKYDDKTGKRVD